MGWLNEKDSGGQFQGIYQSAGGLSDGSEAIPDLIDDHRPAVLSYQDSCFDFGDQSSCRTLHGWVTSQLLRGLSPTSEPLSPFPGADPYYPTSPTTVSCYVRRSTRKRVLSAKAKALSVSPLDSVSIHSESDTDPTGNLPLPKKRKVEASILEAYRHNIVHSGARIAVAGGSSTGIRASTYSAGNRSFDGSHVAASSGSLHLHVDVAYLVEWCGCWDSPFL